MTYKQLCQNSLLKQSKYQARNSKPTIYIHSTPDADQVQAHLTEPDFSPSGGWGRRVSPPLAPNKITLTVYAAWNYVTERANS